MTDPVYNPELDKLTLHELALSLKQKINTAYNHVSDNVRHITEQERKNWNLILDYPVVTAAKKGMMSSADKIKLDTIEEHANNYIHPTYNKLGENGGNFLVVDVNKYGHVTAGYNPSHLDITVTNADKLGNVAAAEYALLTSPVFLGKVNIPTAGDDAQDTEAVNINYYLNHMHPYIKSEEEPDPNKAYLKNLFWIGPKNVLSAYDSSKKWNSVYSEASYSQVALNEKLDVNTIPSDYASFFKFYGYKELSTLNLSSDVISQYPDETYGTVFGMRATDDGISYEFIFIKNDLYFRSGDKTWNKEVKIIDNDDKIMQTIAKSLPPDVTTTEHGLMTAADKVKLDGIEDGANNYVLPETLPASMITEDDTHKFVTTQEKESYSDKYTKAETREMVAAVKPEIVTQTNNGILLAADKIKLDSIAMNANNYKLPDTLPASMITEDDTHKFVTAAQKSQLDNITFSVENGKLKLTTSDGNKYSVTLTAE